MFDTGSGRLKLDARVPALIVRTGDPHWDYGGLATARSLGRLGVRVFALGREPELRVSRYLTAFLANALDVRGRVEESVGAVNSAIASIGGACVAIAGDDESAVLLAEQRHLLDSRLLTARSAATLPRRLSDKVSLGRICQNASIPYPRFLYSSDADEVLSFAFEVGYPVIAKSPAPYLRLTDIAVSNTQIVKTPEKLRDLVRKLPQGDRLFVQKYLHGPQAQVWYAAGYRSASHGAFVATGLKQLAHPASTGVGVLSVSKSRPQLVDLMSRLVADIDYVGPFDSDWVIDQKSGLPYLIDFNPRRGAQFRLFQDHRGMDIVRAAHLDLTGHRIDWEGQINGIVHEVENLALLHGSQALPSAHGAKRQHMQWSWWAVDDPRPAVAVAGQMVGAAARKLKHRVSSPPHREKESE